MKKVKDIISKPSEAVRAMVDGLKEASKRSDFIIDMNTFGNNVGDICCGCAATCAIQKVFDYNFTAYNIYGKATKATALKADVNDLGHFESAIDELRTGYPRSILMYFHIKKQVIDDIISHPMPLPYMGCFSLEELDKYEKFAEYLESKNL